MAPRVVARASRNWWGASSKGLVQTRSESKGPTNGGGSSSSRAIKPASKSAKGKKLEYGSKEKRSRKNVVPKVLQEETALQNTSLFREEDLLAAEGFQGDPLAPAEPVHPVLDIIKGRYNRRFSEDGNNDGFKLGLVVEGGGMRGITSAGMLVELHRRGLDTVFDAVYGSSAGAINSTFFLAQDARGANIYTNHIANSDFISLSRLVGRRKKPVLDISYLLDHVMEEVLPCDWDKVIHAKTPLKILASDIDRSEPVLLSDFRDKQDLVECLRASAMVPGIAGGPVRHRGRSMVDAMVYEPIPIWSAIDDGCTHVLTLSTKPRLEGQHPLDRVKNTLIRDYFMTPKYLDHKLYQNAEASPRGSRVTEAMLGIQCPEESAEAFGAHVYTLFPDVQPVGSLSKNSQKLWKAREQGHEAISKMVNDLFYANQFLGFYE
jgi:predicted patatin/cPLA2 family phospholipase